MSRDAKTVSSAHLLSFGCSVRKNAQKPVLIDDLDNLLQKRQPLRRYQVLGDDAGHDLGNERDGLDKEQVPDGKTRNGVHLIDADRAERFVGEERSVEEIAERRKHAKDGEMTPRTLFLGGQELDPLVRRFNVPAVRRNPQAVIPENALGFSRVRVALTAT